MNAFLTVLKPYTFQPLTEALLAFWNHNAPIATIASEISFRRHNLKYLWHFFQSLRLCYEGASEWDGTKFVGTIGWSSANRSLLLEFQYPRPLWSNNYSQKIIMQKLKIALNIWSHSALII